MSTREIKYWRKGTQKRDQGSPRPVFVALARAWCPGLLQVETVQPGAREMVAHSSGLGF